MIAANLVEPDRVDLLIAGLPAGLNAAVLRWLGDHARDLALETLPSITETVPWMRATGRHAGRRPAVLPRLALLWAAHRLSDSTSVIDLDPVLAALTAIRAQESCFALPILVLTSSLEPRPDRDALHRLLAAGANSIVRVDPLPDGAALALPDAAVADASQQSANMAALAELLRYWMAWNVVPETRPVI